MPQHGMAYDYLSDPGSGPEVYQNAMLSWGMIGIDFGLTMAHGKIAQAMQWAERSYLINARAFAAGDTATLMKDFGLKAEAFDRNLGRWDKKAKRRATGRAWKTYTGKIEDLTGPSKYEMRRAKTKGPSLGSKYMKASRTMKGIGWFAAVIGIADFGFSLMSDMAAPGVSREARDRDREALSNSEGMLDTRMAYTQRQRAIQAIHDSQLSVGRSMIGQESSYLHR